LGLARKIGILIAAIFFALILWTYVHLAGTYEFEIDIPLEVTPPQGLALSGDIPANIHAKLQGAGWQLVLMDITGKTRFSVDLSTRDPQTLQSGQLYLTADVLAASPLLPEDVKVLKIQPDSVKLMFGREVTKRLPISPRLDVQTADGFTLVGEPLIAPGYITVNGSSAVLDSLRFFPTKTLRLRNLREAVTKQLELSDTLREAITDRSINIITIKLDVQAVAEKVFTEVPVTVEAVPPGRDVMLMPATVTVTLRGGVDQLSHLESSEIRARVSYNMLRFDTASTVIPEFHLPKGLEFLTSDPPELKFIVRKQE
jgi:YbbR domain-containing protein